MTKFDKWLTALLLGIILTLIGVVWSQTVTTDVLYKEYYTKQEIKSIIDENQRMLLIKLDYIEKGVQELKEARRK